MNDFLFRGSLADLDPQLHELSQIESERQIRRLILIPSESTAPFAVRQALASTFHNIYAEGYPDEGTRGMTEGEILDYPTRLAHYRRYSDPRYYKGVEYADIAEALARRRCAEVFATNGIQADDLYVNVQALSGAPANNAVYHALVQPGDTVMGMNLLHGGHLTHGSTVNRSGKYYHIVHYSVDVQTERIDYEAVEALAREHKPKMIIAGVSSYPWALDWARFRQIAEAVGAYLLADIAHVAGLVAGGVYPSPLGYADVVTFTTHKSLCGPRGACILTTSPSLSRKIDRAVFPGEQGGPHVNVFLAMALAFKLAKTEQFRQLQGQIVKNCMVLTRHLEERGFRIPYGGTDTHLTNLDCKSVLGEDKVPLSGDQAARILDLVGIVVNRNTIPGDASAANPSGIRMGTPWVTQRGFREAEMNALADLIADVLQATRPYLQGKSQRAKVDFAALENAKLRVRELAENAGMDYEPSRHGYPHFYYLDDQPARGGKWASLEVGGEGVRAFLNYALSSDVEALKPGDSQATCVHTSMGAVDGFLTCLEAGTFQLSVPGDKAGLAATWLRDLSDGYVLFDEADLEAKLPGPVWVQASSLKPVTMEKGDPIGTRKPYFIGKQAESGDPLPPFQWEEKAGEEMRLTTLFNLHKELGAKMVPFAGWEMPVWYSSVVEEHLAVRQAAGLFDVSHMGVYQAEGPDAAVFLDSVCGNDIHSLAVGESLYTHFLDPDANVVDDLLVYRRGAEKYLVVVNASNDDKDWAWLNAVREGRVCVDKVQPWARAYGRNVILRNLRDPQAGKDMRVDIALQGPRSRDILLALGCDDPTRKRILKLRWAELTESLLGGFDLVLSRTGYTGERMAFELFVHPEQAPRLFEALLKAGEPLGLKPCGLGARDSLRTEAGLPLYGHEMAGDLGLGVAEAGFGMYVKTYKPWFIGRQAYLDREKERQGVVVRFRFNEKGVRMAHLGDPVLEKRGKVIGRVTSCAVDSEGYLTGQAFVDLKYQDEGTPIYIFQSAPKEAGKSPAELRAGDRVNIPSAATVMKRFLR
ncbi:MAG: glycine cleavage system aminomethyltransferase GcvT [Chloroflexota bacterium]